MIFDQLVLMVAGTALLLIGIVSIAFSKHLIKSMMAFQVAVFGANLSLFAAGMSSYSIAGSLLVRPSDTFVILSVLVGAAVEAVGLAIIVLVHRKFRTLDPAKVRRPTP